MLKWMLGLLFLGQATLAAPMNEILTAQLLKKKKSFIYSPLSLEVALSMTAEGSAADTRKQFEKVLGLPNSGIYKSLNIKHAEYDFVSAQKVWLQKDYPVLPAFEKALTEDYQSTLERADFKAKASEYVSTINKWVEDKTKDKIKDLIPATALTSFTRLVLVNAVYFKAKWLNEFDAGETRERDFTVDGKKQPVQMMHEKFYGLKYFEAKNFSSVILPYIGDDITFVVFLPKKANGEFDQSFLKEISKVKTSDYKPETTVVMIPKFKTEYTADVESHLKAAGLNLAFDKKKADFSLISSEVKKTPADNLYISNIFHKAFIEVGEKGTEAAAATAVVMAAAGSAMPLQPPKMFIADRPFLYFIKQKDQILFSGYFAGNK